MSRLILILIVKPLESESQPITGWVNDEVTLYAVIKRPAVKYEYPLFRISKGSIAGSTGM
jgi:hypothetical protein